MTGAGELAMFLAMGAAAVGISFGPIGAALARRIGGRPEPGDARAEIEIPSQVTAEVDDLKSRLAEVEERLEFAERVLAQAREADQLPGGQHR